MFESSPTLWYLCKGESNQIKYYKWQNSGNSLTIKFYNSVEILFSNEYLIYVLS